MRRSLGLGEGRGHPSDIIENEFYCSKWNCFSPETKDERESDL